MKRFTIAIFAIAVCALEQTYGEYKFSTAQTNNQIVTSRLIPDGSDIVTMKMGLTDGTNTIDAAGNVYAAAATTTAWNFTSPVAGLSILQPVRYYAEGSTVDEWVDWRGAGWYCFAQYESADYTTSFSVFMVGEANADRLEDVENEIYFTRRVAGKMYPIGKLALTNDIPPAVTVVAPSTNATSGTAADARATGTALYTGFTEWEFYGFSPYVAESFTYSNGVWILKASYDGIQFTFYGDGTEDSTNMLIWTVAHDDPMCRATRHLITPTKTSQLENDSGFITSADLPYRLVEPGKWEFSDGVDRTISGPTAVSLEDEDPVWIYYWNTSGAQYHSQEFSTEALALAALSLVFTSGDNAFTATRASLPGHMCDRAVNRVIVSQTTELTIPESNVGRVRDFYVYMTVSGATQRVSFSPSVQYVGGRVNPDRTYSPATYCLHFMEITNGLFNVVDDFGASGIVLGEKATGAIGVYSLTAGRGCLASGWYSQASGYFVEAKNSNEFSFGRYNSSHRNDGDFGTPSNTLWSVGCGIGSSTRMNAIETMQNGKTFVYGVGGYDGTNPTGSGVRDLASVINGKSPTHFTQGMMKGCMDWSLSGNVVTTNFSIDFSPSEYTLQITINGQQYLVSVEGYYNDTSVSFDLNNATPSTNLIVTATRPCFWEMVIQPNTTTTSTKDDFEAITFKIGQSIASEARECRLVLVAAEDFSIVWDTTKFYNVQSSESIANGTTNIFSFTEFMPDKFIVTKQTIGGSGN